MRQVRETLARVRHQPLDPVPVSAGGYGDCHPGRRARRGLRYGVTATLQTLPLLGPLFKDTGGTGDIYLQISPARMSPIEALRYE